MWRHTLCGGTTRPCVEGVEGAPWKTATSRPKATIARVWWDCNHTSVQHHFWIQRDGCCTATGVSYVSIPAGSLPISLIVAPARQTPPACSIHCGPRFVPQTDRTCLLPFGAVVGCGAQNGRGLSKCQNALLRRVCPWHKAVPWAQNTGKAFLHKAHSPPQSPPPPNALQRLGGNPNDAVSRFGYCRRPCASPSPLYDISSTHSFTGL